MGVLGAVWNLLVVVIGRGIIFLCICFPRIGSHRLRLLSRSSDEEEDAFGQMLPRGFGGRSPPLIGPRSIFNKTYPVETPREHRAARFFELFGKRGGLGEEQRSVC